MIKLLGKSRKPECISFCEKIGINTNVSNYPTIEANTIDIIMQCFETQQMITQYSVDTYKVDLYFPKFKFIIECDEPFHEYSSNIEKDKEQENKISECISGVVFIRNKPYDDKFIFPICVIFFFRI